MSGIDRARRAALLAAAAGLLAACADVNRTGQAAAYYPGVPKVAVRLPANAPSMTQQFLAARPDGGPGHLGVDFAAPIGTPVLAAATGRVYLSYEEPMYGNRIILDHGKDSGGRRVFTVYKHLDTRVVRAGTEVRQGQQIGTLGNTGMLASYPHLHFEVLREPAPGQRTAGGDNWWQGMAAEDPNLFWARGPGQPGCERQLRGGAGPLPLVLPVICR